MKCLTIKSKFDTPVSCNSSVIRKILFLPIIALLNLSVRVFYYVSIKESHWSANVHTRRVTRSDQKWPGLIDWVTKDPSLLPPQATSHFSPSLAHLTNWARKCFAFPDPEMERWVYIDIRRIVVVFLFLCTFLLSICSSVGKQWMHTSLLYTCFPVINETLNRGSE